MTRSLPDVRDRELEPLRMLIFGGSTADFRKGHPYGVGSLYLRDVVAEYLGRSVELQFAYAYPTAGLALHVQRVMDRYAPAIVVLNLVPAAMVEPELSTALDRLTAGRWLPFRRRFSRWGLDSVKSRRTPAARLLARLQDALLEMGLGRTALTPEQGCTMYQNALRCILAAEDTSVVVCGGRVSSPSRSRRYQRNLAAAELKFDRLMSGVCSGRRVPYASLMSTTKGTLDGGAQGRYPPLAVGLDMPKAAHQAGSNATMADGVHFAESWQLQVAQRVSEVLLPRLD